VVVAVDLQLSKNVESQFSVILDCLTDKFYEHLRALSKKVGYVAADEFLRDEEERRLILGQMRQNETLSHINTLPRMSLNSMADFILEKRFNEYRSLWISDMQRMNNPAFLAMMPEKVYRHWSGNTEQNVDSMTFNMILFASLAKLSAITSGMLSIVAIKADKN
jgi:hypothetical protein